jgi:hypothetical protein
MLNFVELPRSTDEAMLERRPYECWKIAVIAGEWNGPVAPNRLPLPHSPFRLGSATRRQPSTWSTSPEKAC